MSSDPVIGVTALLMGLYVCLKLRRLFRLRGLYHRDGIRLTAEVIDNPVVGDERVAYHPVFRFTDPDGQLREAKAVIGSTAYGFGIGLSRPVLWLPDRDEVWPADWPLQDWILGLFLLLGVGLVGLGVWALLRLMLVG